MTEKEFVEAIGELGITPTEEQLKKLNQFYTLLIEWNKKINLTRITDKEEVYLKHFYDSLTIVKEVELSKVETLCRNWSWFSWNRTKDILSKLKSNFNRFSIKKSEISTRYNRTIKIR